ncbi:hypothetical protein [Shimia aestuarii]|uniref:hypothetical protein n=1 Tax=Shimia aestuarii TaxID=254406 RepID=UPI001FB3125D|nr:hypothetical protein [Shimia aestuarii]
MEKILGAKIQSVAEFGIEGLRDRSGCETIFFEVQDTREPRNTFRKLTNETNPPNAKSGGVSEYGCSIEAPNGTVFYALTIHGDVEGWRKDIELGAEKLRVALAKLDGEMLVVDRQLEFPLSECTVEFF